jgi:hypothetical protein
MSSFVVEKSHELINKIQNKNIAIDCTLGNGHDTLFLSSLFNKVYAMDIQPLALIRSKERLKDTNNTFLYLMNHKDIDTLNINNVDLVLYNLGFLPGSDKKVITNYDTTLESIDKALNLINEDGIILIASYIRHPNGLNEYQMIIQYLNENNIQYKEYNIEFVGESITEKFDYFKIDNISGNAIRVEDMKVYALSTGMTYEIDKFEFNPGTTDISFRGSVINDVRHDGKTFMLAVQLKDNKGEIVLDIPNTLTLQTSISGVVSAAIDVNEKGRVTAYFDLTKIIDSNNITTFDFSINVPDGYKLHAILLLEVENVTKPAMSEVREVIVIN